MLQTQRKQSGSLQRRATLTQKQSHSGEDALNDSILGLFEDAINDIDVKSAESWSVPLDTIAPVYQEYLDDETRTQIRYGGSSSGKSYFFVGQRAVYDLMNGGRNYLICRAVAKDSRRSTFVEVQKTIAAWGLGEQFKVNKTDLSITHKNGYQILFAGLDDTEKLKSITFLKGVLTDVVVEEATQAKATDIKQLVRRQRGGDASVRKRLTLLFNPIIKSHWIYKQYFAPIVWRDDQTVHSGERLSILKTTYLDNPFLGEDEIYDLESETDSYWYDVYTLGKWGVLGDVIFRNWKIEDLSGKHNQFTMRYTGLDFGFSSDPAALVQTHYDSKRSRLYIYGELYERELTNDVLAGEVLSMVGHDRVICDSAEPKSIKDLQNLGVSAAGAKKGKDSIRHGIDWLQRQEIVVCESCVNTINELQLYQWKKDRDGNSLRVPVDKNNHIIDALRYATEELANNEGWGIQ